MVVFCLDLNTIQSPLDFKFDCIITYNVTHENEAHELQLYGGLVAIDSEFMLSEELHSVFPVKTPGNKFCELIRTILNIPPITRI